MAFKKGKPKTGGRKPGTPNKRTSVIEQCVARGFDPFDVMIELALAAEGLEKFKMASEIAQYCESKLKAIEHRGEVTSKRVIEITRPDGTGVILADGDLSDEAQDN